MTEVVVVERRRKYHWPEAQLNFWLFIMLVSASTTLGIFAYFITVQNQLTTPQQQVGIPWIFPFEITISGLALLFLVLILILISQRQLLPGIIILGSFILFVLWLTGLIETAIQLFGPVGSINSNCAVLTPFKGISIDTLAYLEQLNICNSWKAAFAFEVVGTVFFFWMGIMAWQVQRDDFE